MKETTYYSKVDKTIVINHCKRTGNFDMKFNHYHDRYEIYYLLSGARRYFVKDRIYQVEKGNVVIVDKNELHKTVVTSNLSHERILIEFEEKYLDAFAEKGDNINLLSVFHSSVNVIKLDKSEQEFFEKLLFRIISESKDSKMGSNIYCRITLVEILIFLNRYVENVQKKDFVHLSPTHEKISDVVKFINANYMKEISLKILSRNFYISSYYLSRTFKDVTGFSFIEYLNNIRIREAQNLLRKSDFNITQISEKVGFESTTHFGRVFKTITGQSPLKFRKIKS